ncbi:MAG: hypothetical protein SFY32_10320 [Bacteroidota bacterium]|nr:hypothetical protein [Bacteroidota bacterium]
MNTFNIQNSIIQLFIHLLIFTFTHSLSSQPTYEQYDQTKEGILVFHPIKTDSKGYIIPWFSSSTGVALEQAIMSTWNFWYTMRSDQIGLPYYMLHQVWRNKSNDPRGIGGDQIQMMLSSLILLYQYTGDEKVKDNARFLADYYLTHSLSPANAVYPNIPYPYNTLMHSGIYDGDMVIGPGYTQPDKAGSLGWEICKMALLFNNYFGPHATSEAYWKYAIGIADCMAKNIKSGDANNSPWPFKVQAVTGEIGILKEEKKNISASYTSNYSGTLYMFEILIANKRGNIESYEKARETLLNWMKNYPLKTNKWGPFFEDVPGWSDTQINAVTFAEYIMNHPQDFPNWKKDVKIIFDWCYKNLGNKEWEKYGVIAINEQTAYQVPGNSHSARQAATELLYTKLSGDTTFLRNAVRVLNWVTYMVDNDGKNCYPRDEIWLTDGYGDYIRHLLKALAWYPELVPMGQNRILHSTTTLNHIEYAPDFNKVQGGGRLSNEYLPFVKIYYRTGTENSIETIRMETKPAKVLTWNDLLLETNNPNEDGWMWTPLKQGGLLRIKHKAIDVKVF